MAEFILFTIPLFIPLAIFLSVSTVSSSLQFDLNNYSRQLVRAYITSPTQESASARLVEVSAAFTSHIFSHDPIGELPSYRITCSFDPCLTPGGLVTVYAETLNIATHQKASATSSEIVDQWR